MSETVAHVLDTRYRTGDVEISENVDFEGLFLSKTILQGLNRAGFVRPSPIQLKAIPIGRCGLDLIIQAKSGTGKTCVFTVIALESVMPGNNRVQALVLAPTREIAFQNAHVVQSIGSSIAKLRSYAFTGGIPLAQDKLKLKCCHVATGTPGRIKQLIEEGTMVTDNIRLFVLDEADKLLEEGFQDTINWIYSHLPENKQIIAASATYTEDLAQFLMRYMRNPTFVRLNSNDPALLGVKQYYKVTPFHTFVQKVFEEKDAELFKLLNKISFNQCIIFSNYQARAQVLCDKLTSKGWPTMYISGSQDQQQRMHVMSTLQKFQCRILISTDLTSRGIDAEHVNLVLNLDVPWDKETYLHRIGRAGRFGTVGIAVTFASKGNEEEQLMKIKNDIGLQLIPLPDRIDNTIWQLDSPGQNLTVKSAPESLEKAPIAKEESTNPFENVSKSPSLEQCNEEEPPLQNIDFRRDKKRDSVISKSSNSTRNSTDSTSTDQSIHTVISRCQSLVGEDVNESESKDTIEEEIKPPLLSVISRCESTDEIVEETKKEGDEEEPYVPTSVKNRIHEFERYIVKLINAGDVVKSDPTTPTTPPTDAATKRSILKDLRDMSTVKGSNSSGEIDEFTKTITPKRLVKCETWDSHERERKGLTKSATVDVHLETEPAQPKTVDINFELPKPDIDLPKKTMYKSATFDLSSARVVQQISSLKRGKSESDVIVEEKTDDVKSAVEKCETTHSGEVRDNFDNGFNRSTLEIKLSDTKATNEPPLVTESYKDLEADLERFIDSTFSCGDNFSLEQAKNLDKVQDVKEIEIINEGSESGDDKIRVSKYAEECMKRICSLDFKPSDDVAEEWKKYQEHWEQFKDEIRSLESEEDQVVSSKKITTDKQDEDTKSIDKRECYVNTKFEIVDVQLIKPELETENETKIALQPTIIVDDGIEKLNKMDSCDFIQSDIVDRVTLLSKMTSEHEWIFSSSSIDAPDTENDEKENESDNDVMTSETDNKEENSTDADAKNESNGSGECILQEESVTTENETTEEDSSESNESEESESSEHAEGKEETGSTTTVENPPEGNQWTDYWKSFSDWASQMHKGPIIDSTKSQIGANQPFPSFPFPAPPFSPQMPPMTPMIPQMSSMWPQVQFPGAASPFNTCCNCSMASAWWNQYWSFYYWQMMMMHKSKEKKQ